MKTKAVLGIVCGVVCLFALSAGAQQNLVESVANGCKAELETYCKDVTPDPSRILACLYARNDKLSGKCEFAFYDAAAQLERAVAALAYAANECDDDLDQFCRDVAAGKGRLLTCLEKNDQNVSARCKKALQEVGLKE
jgi:Cysteine rich repeat